ncbi:hypothetical protein B0H10DRAFT_2439908 [Mycena sp. CBHHK59/15]|nr:hypothetical protein B0H10DRAFT_2439908 [Mycena sp. CBHHK59/15]
MRHVNLRASAQGLDKAIALRLAEDVIDVAVNDIPHNAENFARTVEEINSKGALAPRTLRTPTVDEWNRIMTINGRGTFLCYKYAGMQMIAQGRIIGLTPVCSVASLFTSSKWAVRGLTQAAATEFGSHGITVNMYAPGVIDTDIFWRLAVPKIWAERRRLASSASRLPVDGWGNAYAFEESRADMKTQGGGGHRQPSLLHCVQGISVYHGKALDQRWNALRLISR